MLREALEGALREHVVTDPIAPASYALYETPVVMRGTRPLYRIYKDCTNLFTTPSLARALSVLVGFLDDASSPKQSEHSGSLRLHAAGLVGQDRAVLASWTLPYRYPSLESGLRRDGIRLLERRSVLVDVDTAELVVPRSRLTVAEWGAHRTTDALEVADQMTSAGRYPIAAWIFETLTGPARELSRAEAVARGLRVVYRDGQPVASSLRRLASLVTRVEHLRVAEAECAGRVARTTLAG